MRTFVSILSVPAALAVLVAAPALGCAYSNFQTAKMLPKGGTSVAGALSSYSIQINDEEVDEEALEVIVSHGLSDKFEIGGKVAWFLVEDVDCFNLLVIPKYSLIPDKLALTFPSGLIFVTGDDGDDADKSWLFMPGVVFTQRINGSFEFDGAAKPVIHVADDFSENNVAGAVNLGIRVTAPGQRWSVFPELGVMIDDDSDEDYYLHLGIAFGYELGPARAAATAP